MTNQPGPNPNPQPHFNPQGSQAYSTTPAPGWEGHPPGAPQPPKKPNVVAIAALVVAVLAFLFSVIEGAYLVGWILIPIALVLSIVALVQKFQPKKLAITALIVSIIAGIAAPIAFLASAARAFNDSFGGTEVTAAPPGQSAPAQSGDAATTGGAEPDASGEQGTRTNPYPLGTAISSKDWTVTVNSFEADATKKVLAENEFNKQPADGNTYAMANVTVTYIGETSGTPFEINVSYVTASGNTVNTYDATVLGPDELPSNELYNGASATGNIFLQIPKDDAGALRVRPGFIADEVFVAIK
ncbi:DUF4352 domain-containing protein [Ammonicoccus fulvus]|uniref:DUF4352 domain-containing protein n=1 Tax=Ammonicoccus fulvus TaxID=3138240 RepID=A0ABZ3FSD4_9ACTN